jgi:hypothetical protein
VATRTDAFSPDGARIVFSAATRRPQRILVDKLRSLRGRGRRLHRAAQPDGRQPGLGRAAGVPRQRRSRLACHGETGFEADRYVVKLRSAKDGGVRALTQDWDRSVTTLTATHDRRRLLGIADDVGQTALFEIDPASGQRSTLVGDGQVQGVSAAPQGAVVAVGLAGRAARLSTSPTPQRRPKPQRQPALTARGLRRTATAANAARLADRQLGEFEQFAFAGSQRSASLRLRHETPLAGSPAKNIRSPSSCTAGRR